MKLKIVDQNNQMFEKECDDWIYDYGSNSISLWRFKKDFEAGEGDEEPQRNLIARFNNISSFEKIEPLEGVEKEKK